MPSSPALTTARPSALKSAPLAMPSCRCSTTRASPPAASQTRIVPSSPALTRRSPRPLKRPCSRRPRVRRGSPHRHRPPARREPSRRCRRWRSTARRRCRRRRERRPRARAAFARARRCARSRRERFRRRIRSADAVNRELNTSALTYPRCPRSRRRALPSGAWMTSGVAPPMAIRVAGRVDRGGVLAAREGRDGTRPPALDIPQQDAAVERCADDPPAVRRELRGARLLMTGELAVVAGRPVSTRESALVAAADDEPAAAAEERNRSRSRREEPSSRAGPTSAASRPPRPRSRATPLRGTKSARAGPSVTAQLGEHGIPADGGQVDHAAEGRRSRCAVRRR